MTEFDPIIDALKQSARNLDSDAESIPTPEFRARCRAQLARAASRDSGFGRLPVSPRLAVIAVAACLSLLLVVPAMAGPGVGGTMSTVGHGVRHMFDAPANSDQLMSDPQGPFSASDATPGATPTHPENHGLDVSTVAKATPEPGENHGEQVRDVARDNYGHNKGTVTPTSTATASPIETSTATATATETATATATATETSTATATATETGTATATATATDQPDEDSGNHGSDVSNAAQTTPESNHGSDVSSAAQSTPEAGENHGQQVRDVARDNHGQDVSGAAHGTATATPDTSSSASPNTTPESSSSTGAGNSSHGGGKGHGGN
jgi:hypothetical protein